MKKTLAILFGIISFVSADVVDLGTYGATHTIKEENFMDIVEKKSKDLNATLLTKQLKESNKQFLSINHLLPSCKETRKREYVPTFIVPADIKLPNGTYIARAGEELNTLEVMRKSGASMDRYVMFIDADDDIQVQLAFMYKNQGIAFLTNGSLEEFEKRTRMTSFKADMQSIAKFNIECSPSLTIQDGNKMIIYEYSVEDLEKKEKGKS